MRPDGTAGADRAAAAGGLAGAGNEGDVSGTYVAGFTGEGVSATTLVAGPMLDASGAAGPITLTRRTSSHVPSSVLSAAHAANPQNKRLMPAPSAQLERPNPAAEFACEAAAPTITLCAARTSIEAVSATGRARARQSLIVSRSSGAVASVASTAARKSGG